QCREDAPAKERVALEVVGGAVERRTVVVPVVRHEVDGHAVAEPAFQERALDAAVADRHRQPGHDDSQRAGDRRGATGKRHHDADVVAEPREGLRQRPGHVGEAAGLGEGRNLRCDVEDAQPLAGGPTLLGTGARAHSSTMGYTSAVTCELMRLRLVSTSRWISEVSTDSARPARKRSMCDCRSSRSRWRTTGRCSRTSRARVRSLAVNATTARSKFFDTNAWNSMSSASPGSEKRRPWYSFLRASSMRFLSMMSPMFSRLPMKPRRAISRRARSSVMVWRSSRVR